MNSPRQCLYLQMVSRNDWINRDWDLFDDSKIQFIFLNL